MPGNGLDGDGLFRIAGVFDFCFALSSPPLPPLPLPLPPLLFMFCIFAWDIGGFFGAGLAGENVFLGILGDSDGGEGEGVPRLPVGGFGTDSSDVF